MHHGRVDPDQEAKTPHCQTREHARKAGATPGRAPGQVSWTPAANSKAPVLPDADRSTAATVVHRMGRLFVLTAPRKPGGPAPFPRGTVRRLAPQEFGSVAGAGVVWTELSDEDAVGMVEQLG